MKPEHERRWLATLPDKSRVTRTRVISDHYLRDTHIRLRHQFDSETGQAWKVTRKVDGQIGTLHVSQQDFTVLAALPGARIEKIRHSVDGVGIDVFDGRHQGLVLAEFETDDAATLAAFSAPDFCHEEVTRNPFYTGGRLAWATAAQLRAMGLGFGS